MQAATAQSASALMDQFVKLRERRWLRAGLDRLAWHVSNPQFEWHHQEGGRLPRNYLWRPCRFCVQDVVLGLTVLRHRRDFNCLEVDVFLTASIPEYEADSGARALALLLLSEAYKCGGTMEIRFTRHVEGKRVPHDLVALAEAVGVPLQHVGDGVITPAEARRLYVALTGFSPQLQAHIEALEQAGRLSGPLICYAIHHGLWERAEVEAILLTSPRPGSLLSGQARPEQRHLYLQDLLYGRAAVLFGFLDRHLRYRAHPHESGVVHLEDDERPLDLHLDGDTYAATYCCPQETVTIPWVAAPAGNGTASNGTHVLVPGQPFTVLVRARDAADLAANLESDLQQAAKVRRTQTAGPVYVLVPRDFEKLPDELRWRLIQNRTEGVGLLVYRQFVSALDDDVARRLRASGVMRA